VRVCECESFLPLVRALFFVKQKRRTKIEEKHKENCKEKEKRQLQSKHPKNTKQTSAAAMEKRIELERRARKVNQVSQSEKKRATN